MNDSRQRGQNDDRKEETPPYSRVFVVCSKQLTEEDLSGPFEKFGTIESMYMPRDRNTGDSKGIAYIKYTKTSAAAAAVQAMNLVCIKNTHKPLKVMVANQKNDDDSIAPESKYMRLFIMLSKNDTEADIKNHFSTFGEVHSVYVQKNKGKFAYVSYKTFLDAARAYEECDRKYKAVFATPKEELKRSRDSFESNMGSFNSSNSSLFQKDRLVPLDPMMPNSSRGCKRICVTVTPHLTERYIGNLFNIIPGMLNLQYSIDTYNGTSKAIITYDNDKSAALAVERVNNFEFPSGEIVSVKLDDNVIATAAKTLTNMVNTLRNAMDVGTSPNELVQLADAIAHASTLIKVASTGMTESLDTSGYCSVRLPPTQDLVDGRSHVAKRCFIVCKPHPPPPHVLKDVFCRFGDLIDVMTYPNKTFGFAKYASASAADDAIGTLNGATVSGIKLKVLEADEKQAIEDNSDKKRMKMDIDSKTI